LGNTATVTALKDRRCSIVNVAGLGPPGRAGYQEMGAESRRPNLGDRGRNGNNAMSSGTDLSQSERFIMRELWNRSWFGAAAMLMGAIATAVIMGLPRTFHHDALAQDINAPGLTPTVNDRDLVHAEGLSNAFRNVAEAIRPSVVSISTRQVQSRPQLPPGFPRFYEDFFGGRGGSQEETGMGSGVIVRPDGYILTNNHVVEGADELRVELSDGRIVEGKIVGTDPQTDLAVVKIELPELRAAPIGNSDDIRVGDWVLAIGSPFGLDQTVTAGIISGKHRQQRIIADGNGLEDFLQTDAAINPGNSGGPLVNLRGELVGINTAILSRSGASAGIGFAIPVSLAGPVLESIIESGVVRRGFLGAQVVDVTPTSVEDFDLKVKQGALIGGVLENQPAAKAGLQPGDVVTKMDGRPCTGGTQLVNYVASRRPGTSLELEVNRGGQTLRIRVDLQERTDEAMALFKGGDLFGAKLIPVTPESAERYGYTGLRSGLIVAEVQDGSIAADAELQVGDVIESAAGLQLKSVDELTEIVSEAQRLNQPIRIVVRRGNTRMLLLLR
jgi:serine protease Do